MQAAVAAEEEEGLAARRSLLLAWRLIRETLSRSLPLSLALALPFVAFDLAADGSALTDLERYQLAGVLQLFIGLAGTLALARLFLGAARRTPFTLGQALLFAVRRWPTGVAASLFAGLVIGIGVLALVIPGVIAALTFSLMTPLVAATELDPNQVLRWSKSLTYGDRVGLLKVFAAALLISQPPALLWGLLPPGTGALHVAISLASEVLASLGDGFLVAVQVACFHQLLQGSGAALGLEKHLR